MFTHMQNVSEKSEGMSIIRQFFNIGKEPEFDIKKRVDEYLLKLPQCSRSVVVVCQKYQETHYRCEIEVAAEKLLPWAVNHSYTVSSTHLEEQAARIALPVWLSRKNSQENSSSYIPFLMHKVLRPYVLDFISDGIADVYCIECKSYVTDIYMQKLDKKSSEDGRAGAMTGGVLLDTSFITKNKNYISIAVIENPTRNSTSRKLHSTNNSH